MCVHTASREVQRHHCPALRVQVTSAQLQGTVRIYGNFGQSSLFLWSQLMVASYFLSRCCLEANGHFCRLYAKVRIDSASLYSAMVSFTSIPIMWLYKRFNSTTHIIFSKPMGGGGGQPALITCTLIQCGKISISTFTVWAKLGTSLQPLPRHG